MGDLVRMTAYVTDARYATDYEACVRKAFAGSPLPAATMVNINHLAHPGMLLEVSVIAMVAARPGQAFAKTADHYQAKWSGGSAEVVTVSGPDRTLYLSTLAADGRAGDASRGDIQAQCRETLGRIGRSLAAEGAGFSDMVRTTTFVASDTTLQDLRPCTSAAFKGSPRRATGAFLNLVGFPERDERFGYDVTAVVPTPPGPARLERRAITGPSDGVAISGPRRMIYLAGIDDEPGGAFRQRCGEAFRTAAAAGRRRAARRRGEGDRLPQ